MLHFIRSIGLAAFLIALACNLGEAAPDDASASNGGLTQGQSWFMQPGGDYPFVNLFKMAQTWSFISGPRGLDANGYPTYPIPKAYQPNTVFSSPAQSERPGHYVVLASGTKTISLMKSQGGGFLNTVTCTYASNGGASRAGVSTSHTCSNLGCAGACTMRWEISSGGETATSNIEWNLSIQANGPNDANVPVEYLGFVHVNDSECSDESAFMVHDALGGVPAFGCLFTKRVAQGHFGVWRYLDWTWANVSNCTTFATTKPITYAYYNGVEIRPSMIAATSTYTLNGSSNDYATTFGSGAPVDKETFIVPIPALGSATNSNVTLNLNGTGAVPVKGLTAGPLAPQIFPIAGWWITVTYDATLNVYLMQGAGASSNSGLNCGVPPAVLIELAKELGMHPYFVMPPLALDPMTDYVPKLAALVKSTGPSWMIPRFETPNEGWNTQFPQCYYGSAKSLVEWGVSATFYCGGGGDYSQWEGKVASTIGQAVSAVYGNDRTKYKVLVGVQTVATPSLFAHAFDSAAYVAQAAPPQAGYTKTAASGWVTGLVIANYWGSNSSPQQEPVSAFQYAATPTTAIINAYVGSDQGPLWNAATAAWLSYESSNFGLTQVDGYEGGYSNNTTNGVDDTSTNITGISKQSPAVVSVAPEASFTGTITGTQLVATGVTKAAYVAFPGGIYVGATVLGACVTPGTKVVSYAPGTLTGYGGAGTYTVDASQSVSCAMTTSGTAGSGARGVGSPVTISGVLGMTQINNPGPRSVTFASSSAVISGTNSLLAGQAVVFAGASVSAPFVAGTTYCVLTAGLSSSAFQVTTAARCAGAGTAVAAGAAGRGTAQEAWFIAAFSAANSTITLSVDSTAFGTYSSCPAFTTCPVVRYYGTAANVDALRTATYNSSIVGTYTASILSAHVAAGGEFPSMYNLSGPRGNFWGVWLPDIYGATNSASDPGTTQWQAIVKCNSGIPCSYPFLLKRDLDPAANDNAPMWLSEAA